MSSVLGIVALLLRARNSQLRNGLKIMLVRMILSERKRKEFFANR